MMDTRASILYAYLMPSADYKTISVAFRSAMIKEEKCQFPTVC